MIKYYRGDLFKWPTFSHQATLTYFAHGVNASGVMGAGIAKGFREMWPRMYDQYKIHCELKNVRLGDARLYECPKGWDGLGQKTYRIINLFTQPRPGPCADLVALALSVERMCSIVSEGQIVMPLVGSGLGGLRPNDCRRAIEMAHEGHEVYVDLHVIDEFVEGMEPAIRGPKYLRSKGNGAEI